jgi:uncharacterized membrane protein YfcA
MKKIVCYQILKGYVLKILINVDNDSGGYIAVEFFFIVSNVIAGVIFGLFMVDYLPQKILIAMLAAFTLFTGIKGLYSINKNIISENSGKISKKSFSDRLILFAGGIFQGAFSSGGPLVVMYAAKAIPEKSTFRATLPLLWFTTNSCMNIKWLIAGNVWNIQLFNKFLWVLPFIVCGMFTGDYLHHKVDQKKFTIMVYTLLMIVAIIMTVKCFAG